MLTVESNKLKLENAALRAENHLLKRYLSYFENLFARKNFSTSKPSNDDTYATQVSTEESYSKASNTFKTPFRNPAVHKLPNDVIFQESNDLEATGGVKVL